MTGPTASPVHSPDALVRTGLDASLQHIALLQAKRERLLTSQVEGEGQLLHRANAVVMAGGMTELDLADIYTAYSAIAAPGYTQRWNAAIPIPAARMKYIQKN